MFTAVWDKDMTWFLICLTDKGSAVKTFWPLFWILLRFVYVRIKHDAFFTLLSHHAHYVICSHFVRLYPFYLSSLLWRKFVFFSYPLNYKICCQLMSNLVEMLYWLIISSSGVSIWTRRLFFLFVSPKYIPIS